MSHEKSKIEEEAEAEFEKWYAKMLPIAPDISPYKDILFLAFIAGAIYDANVKVNLLELLVGKPH